MGKKASNLRRDYFIKKWLQFKFSLVFIIIIVTCNAIFGTYIFTRIKDQLRYNLYTSHTKLQNTWEIIEKIVLEASLWSIVIFFSIFLVAIYLLTRRLSKEFDVITMDVEQLKSGDLTKECEMTPVKTMKLLRRNYDDLKSYLRSNINEVKENINKLDSAMERFERFSSERDREGIAATLEELESYSDELQENIDKINI